MLKRSVPAFLTCALLIQVCGCATMRMIPLATVEGDYRGRVIATTVFGDDMRSDPGTLSIVASDTLFTQIDGHRVVIPIASLRYFRVRRFDLVSTMLAVFGTMCFLTALAYMPG